MSRACGPSKWAKKWYGFVNSWITMFIPKAICIRHDKCYDKCQGCKFCDGEMVDSLIARGMYTRAKVVRFIFDQASCKYYKCKDKI